LCLRCCFLLISGPSSLGAWSARQLSERGLCAPQRNDSPRTWKCGTWTADPFNDFCYLFNFLSQRTWSDARADCVNQGGDLLSITEPFEQAFIQGMTFTLNPTGISLWMGGHDSVTEGYSWSDGTPLSHTNWGYGEPNNHEGREECVEMVSSTNGTQSWWNDLNSAEVERH
uniref:C-type lectin domain-containing protein n=1 Tax=Amphiprion ocellaris TaxID=80972 RepID=A0AAQ6ANF3_AMPOC